MGKSKGPIDRILFGLIDILGASGKFRFLLVKSGEENKIFFLRTFMGSLISISDVLIDSMPLGNSKDTSEGMNYGSSEDGINSLKDGILNRAVDNNTIGESERFFDMISGGLL